MSVSNSPLATDCRLAQPVTPETVYSPTLAGRRSKPRNLMLLLLLFFGIFKDALWVTMTIGVQAMLEFLWILVYCVVLSAIDTAAPSGFPPATATDCRLAQPVTPETVYSPTLAGRRSKLRNLLLCLTRAGFEPTTSSTAVQRLTTVPTRQARPSRKYFDTFHIKDQHAQKCVKPHRFRIRYWTRQRLLKTLKYIKYNLLLAK